MKVGFTGTRNGMTEAQIHTVTNLVKALEPTEFHHGDCIGADADAHSIVRRAFPSCPIHIHPPENTVYQAQCSQTEPGQSITVYPPKPYLERDHDIVDATVVMIATPAGEREEQRSGTWTTIRYGLRTNKPVFIVYPDGHIYLQ